MQTSTRPSKKVEPPTSLTSPSVQSVCFYEFSQAYMYIMFISKHKLTEYGQTPGTNIPIMTTVRAAQWISLTVDQVILCSKTNNIVKPDWFAWTITKVGLSWCASTCNEKEIWVPSILHMPVSFTYLHSPILVVCRLLHCLVWQRSPDKQCPRYYYDRPPLDLHTYYYHQQASHLLQCNFLKKSKVPPARDNLYVHGTTKFPTLAGIKISFTASTHHQQQPCKLYLSLDLVPHTNWLSVCLEPLLLHTYTGIDYLYGMAWGYWLTYIMHCHY